jgi:hypothetical protein
MQIIFTNKHTLQLFTISSKQKLFTKYIKYAKQRSLDLGKLQILQLKGWNARVWKLEEYCLIKIRECLVRANICNRS